MFPEMSTVRITDVTKTEDCYLGEMYGSASGGMDYEKKGFD
jgi:hypothetical protein